MPTVALGALAAAAWLTLALQFGLQIQSLLATGNHGVLGAIVGAAGTYLFWFTLLTNTFCAAILSAHLRGRSGPIRDFLRRPGVVTCAAGAIIIVGVVYHLLLASTFDPQGLNKLTDTMLHTVLPIGFVLAWTRLVPKGAVQLSDTPWWISYMLGYAAYILVRGAIAGNYPYFFIDVASLGYPVALRNAGLLGLAFLALSAAMVGLNRLVGAPRPSES